MGRGNRVLMHHERRKMWKRKNLRDFLPASALPVSWAALLLPLSKARVDEAGASRVQEAPQAGEAGRSQVQLAPRAKKAGQNRTSEPPRRKKRSLSKSPKKNLRQSQDKVAEAEQRNSAVSAKVDPFSAPNSGSGNLT